MRGSRRITSREAREVGIIPAHAGLTVPVGGLGTTNGDHPRACGAHDLLDRADFAGQGSSPRMRGSLRLLQGCHSLQGIIPAHAGLTQIRLRCRRSSWDHPRACGAHVRKLGGYERVGIIPAHAGLTGWLFSMQALKRDHPRACGAHESLYHAIYNLIGSSPRMRGSQCIYDAWRSRSGIIPAHAGLT